ncbi:MAG TPA: cystathionine gamma-synthase family protein [Caulobacteraceae bacterium]|jgi:methionine-gamma-lyase|nr:cystathionine gamma-synthase family protein [Caulobacteraceae bacterium]
MTSTEGAPGSLRRETLAIGAGYDPSQAWGAAKPPMVLTSTYVFPSAQAAKDFHRAFFDGATEAEHGGPIDEGFIYSRLSHPNLTMVEARMAALDGAEDCAAFNSGMAAISTVALSLLRPGDSVVHSQPIYSGADNMLNQVMTGMGVHIQGVARAVDGEAIRAAAQAARAKGPLRLFMLESPANPTAALVDIGLVRQIAEEIAGDTDERPLISVDNTFLGPLLQRPASHGADLTITSLTKYCGGHSDLLGGSVSGPAELVGKLKALRTIVGNHMEPFTAWLMLRSLESLAVRQERACANAAVVAAFLRDHPKVTGVTYLGFLEPGTSERAVYDRQCGGAGSTFSFTLAGGESEAFRFLDQLKLLKLAVSLGGSETLICHSATTTHYAVPRERREAGGIFEGTMRLSVGLEHPDDLIAELIRALEAV